MCKSIKITVTIGLEWQWSTTIGPTFGRRFEQTWANSCLAGSISLNEGTKQVWLHAFVSLLDSLREEPWFIHSSFVLTLLHVHIIWLLLICCKQIWRSCCGYTYPVTQVAIIGAPKCMTETIENEEANDLVSIELTDRPCSAVSATREKDKHAYEVMAEHIQCHGMGIRRASVHEENVFSVDASKAC